MLPDFFQFPQKTVYSLQFQNCKTPFNFTNIVASLRRSVQMNFFKFMDLHFIMKITHIAQLLVVDPFSNTSKIPFDVIIYRLVRKIVVWISRMRISLKDFMELSNDVYFIDPNSSYGGSIRRYQMGLSIHNSVCVILIGKIFQLFKAYAPS